MSSRIEYKKGDLINGVPYLEDVEPMIDNRNKPIRQAKFQCPYCGCEFINTIRQIKSKQKSCGCLQKADKYHYAVGDVVNGAVITKLLPDEYTEGRGRRRMAEFICPKCGDTMVAEISCVRQGQISSCGCANLMGKKDTWHKLSKTKEYLTWKDIKARCYGMSEEDRHYDIYIGKGIEMWDGWIHNPVAFCEYVRNLPNFGVKGFSLDREDGNKGYIPGNIRWADGTTQSANREKDERTIYTGVYMCRGRWQSRINYRKKVILFGTFDTPEQACIARDKYIIENNLMQYGYKVQMLQRPCLN